MRHPRLPHLRFALTALAGIAGIASANDAFDLMDDTMDTAFALASLDADAGLVIHANGVLQPGAVVTGFRGGTGEHAVLVIDDSISSVELIGLEDDDPIIGHGDFRSHVRELRGTLIGTASVLDVTVLAIANPDTLDGWALLPTSINTSFFEGMESIDFSEEAMTDLEGTLLHLREDGGLDTAPPTPQPNPGPTPFQRFCLDANGDPVYPAPRYRPFCICNRFYNCHLALQAYPGPEPACNPVEANGGIPECMRASFCRWKKCVWAAATNDALCRCEAIKKSCRNYKRRFGVDPGPMWRGRANTIGCIGAAQSLACSAVLAAEQAGCIWPF